MVKNTSKNTFPYKNISLSPPETQNGLKIRQYSILSDMVKNTSIEKNNSLDNLCIKYDGEFCKDIELMIKEYLFHIPSGTSDYVIDYLNFIMERSKSVTLAGVYKFYKKHGYIIYQKLEKHIQYMKLIEKDEEKHDLYKHLVDFYSVFEIPSVDSDSDSDSDSDDE